MRTGLRSFGLSNSKVLKLFDRASSKLRVDVIANLKIVQIISTSYPDLEGREIRLHSS